MLGHVLGLDMPDTLDRLRDSSLACQACNTCVTGFWADGRVGRAGRLYLLCDKSDTSSISAKSVDQLLIDVDPVGQ